MTDFEPRILRYASPGANTVTPLRRSWQMLLIFWLVAIGAAMAISIWLEKA
jgi:hypothetical protein